MSNKSTQQQLDASDPSASVWVRASAGTGKTKVLTDRVLRLLLEGTAPHKILCITFTNAAAAEMKKRISDSLGRWAIQDNNDLENELQILTGKKLSAEKLSFARRLFALITDHPDDLKIQTIHSFCQSLLGRFPLEADVNPHFQVMDERTAKEFLRESWLRLLSGSALEIDPENLEEIRNTIKKVSIYAAESTLSNIINQVISERSTLEKHIVDQENFEQYIKIIYDKLGAIPGESEENIISTYCSDILRHEKLRALGNSLINFGNDNDNGRGETLLNWLSANTDERAKKFSNCVKLFLTDELTARKKIATKNVIKNFPETEEIITLEQQKLSSVLEKIKSQKIANYTRDVLLIAGGVLRIYENMKRHRSLLDYDDLISKAYELLNVPGNISWVMFKLDEGIDHILLDEAQDNSPQQWQIIKALSSEFFSGETKRSLNRTIFVVGDEKQSIFSFQGADPSAFHDAKEYFKNIVSGSRRKWQQVDLNISFRSVEPVLAVVDKVFAREELRNAVTDDKIEIRHIANRAGQIGNVEIWPLIGKVDEEEKIAPWPIPNKIIRRRDPQQQMAIAIASTIKGWLEQGRMLHAAARPVTPGDIMILVRRRTVFVDQLVKALKNNNINVAGVDRMVITEHIAVMDLIALGNFLLLLSDDLTLATILKCPLFDFSEEELFDIAYNRGTATLWENLKNKQNTNNKYKSAVAYLSELLANIDFAAPFELYSMVLEAKNGRKLFISRMGNEVNDPLDEFLNLALEYENSHTPSMQGFLNWLSAGKTEIKRDLEHGGDYVRIMTVHASKGLQAPIVFLPDTTQLPKPESGLIADENDEIVFWTNSALNRNKLCQNLSEQIAERRKDEYYRLLYVAMTRAADELYVTGWGTADDKSWYKIIREIIFSDAKKVEVPQMLKEIITSGEILRITNNKTGDKFNLNEAAKTKTAVKLEDWALKVAAEEKVKTSIIKPSLVVSEEEVVASPLKGFDIYERGRLVHLLLQYLPDIQPEKRRKTAEVILHNQKSNLTEKQLEKLTQETFNIIENKEFAPLFSIGSKAEVPISSIVPEGRISGQVDRLIITEDKVMIVDYKTNQLVPESNKDIPKSYLKQMATYRTVLQKIYPDKQVECLLLWTGGPKLMKIEEEVLV